MIFEFFSEYILQKQFKEENVRMINGDSLVLCSRLVCLLQRCYVDWLKFALLLTTRLVGTKATLRFLQGFIETLVICILCDRKPLWKVRDFWEKQDFTHLFPDIDVNLELLNDDAYGHALD